MAKCDCDKYGDCCPHEDLEVIKALLFQQLRRDFGAKYPHFQVKKDKTSGEWVHIYAVNPIKKGDR